MIFLLKSIEIDFCFYSKPKTRTRVVAQLARRPDAESFRVPLRLTQVKTPKKIVIVRNGEPNFRLAKLKQIYFFDFLIYDYSRCVIDYISVVFLLFIIDMFYWKWFGYKREKLKLYAQILLNLIENILFFKKSAYSLTFYKN